MNKVIRLGRANLKPRLSFSNGFSHVWNHEIMLLLSHIDIIIYINDYISRDLMTPERNSLFH